MKADNHTSVYGDKKLDTTIEIVNKELQTAGSYGINLNMQHTFKPDEKLSVNFDYLDYNHKNLNDYNNAYFVDKAHSYNATHLQQS